MPTIKAIKDDLLSRYKCTKEQSTHLLMNGGCLHIPIEDVKKLYEDLEKNERNPPLVERIGAYSKGFKMFLDVDKQDECKLKPQEIAEQLAEISILFLPEIDNRFTIFKNTEKETYHIIFQFIVTKEICEDIMAIFKRDFKDYNHDETVYNTGLRLPYCIKKQKDVGVYKYYSGYQSDITTMASISYTVGYKLSPFSEEYNTYLEQTETEEFVSKRKEKINKACNKIFNTEDKWQLLEVPGDVSYKIIRDNKICLVNQNYSHDEKAHSCLYVNAYNVVVSCFSHGNRTIKRDTKLMMILGIKPAKFTIKHDVKDVKEIEILEQFNSNIGNSHDDCAKNFYFMYRNRFVCAQEKPSVIWYECRKGKWEKLDGISEIRRVMVEEFLDIYRSLSNIYSEAMDDPVNCPEFLLGQSPEYIGAKLAMIEATILRLKSKGNTDSVINHSMCYFKIEKFIDKLDQKPELLCFGKKTFDLERCEWRETFPDDYSSFACGVSYEEIIAVDDTKKFDELIESIFPLEERRDYFLNRLSDYLFGKNIKEQFSIWTGSGGNGKGVISTILRHAFGDYFYTANVSGITQKRAAANAADPDLANFRGKRIIAYPEPCQGARLNNSIMKSYTGNDTMKARELFCSPIEFNPTFHPYIETNSLALQDIQDDSIPRRLDFISFRMRFVDNPRLQNHAKRDNTIKSTKNMKLFKVCLMKKLLEQWCKLTEEYGDVSHPFPVPETNLKDKKEFLSENDEVKEFIDSVVTVTNNPDNIITAKELYNDYKELLKEDGRRCYIKYGQFTRRLQNTLPVEYKERHRPRINGKQMNYRKCFLNVVRKAYYEDTGEPDDESDDEPDTIDDFYIEKSLKPETEDTYEDFDIPEILITP